MIYKPLYVYDLLDLTIEEKRKISELEYVEHFWLDLPNRNLITEKGIILLDFNLHPKRNFVFVLDMVPYTCYYDANSAKIIHEKLSKFLDMNKICVDYETAFKEISIREIIWFRVLGKFGIGKSIIMIKC